MKLEKKITLYFLIGIIVILGSFLRIYNLGGKSLFGDELCSVRDSKTVRWWEGHLPLFFYVLHFFMYMGTSEFILRLPSAIFGVLAILMSYKIGKLFFGTKQGLVTAFLLSISTMHIYYSQQVRMYSLFVFLSLLSLFFFYKCFTEENKREIWIGFIISTVLNLYTHFFAAFVVIAEIMFLALIVISKQISKKQKSNELPKRTFLLFVLSMIIIFIIYIPIIITRIPQRGLALLEDKPHSIPMTFVLAFLTQLLSWFSNGNWIGLEIGFMEMRPFLEIPFYAHLIFFLLGSVFLIKKFKERGTLLLMWVALPIVLLLTFLTRFPQWGFPSAPKYIIFVLPIYLLIISSGIIEITKLISKAEERTRIAPTTHQARESRKSLVVLSLILIIFCSLSIPGLLGYYNTPYPGYYWNDENWRGAAKYVESKSQPNDMILVEPEFAKPYFLHYYPTKNNVLSPKSLTEIEGITKFNRVWFVYSHTHCDVIDKDRKIWDWLNQNSDSTINVGAISVFFISPQEHPLFKAAVFAHTEWADLYIPWINVLTMMGVSTSTFNDTTIISDIKLSEFDIAVFVDFMRDLDDVERLHLEESIRDGLIVIVSGISPPHLAGGTANLTRISSWFGATVFSEAPEEARWKVKFTEDAKKIMKDLDLDHEYAFHSELPLYQTPTGCFVLSSESVVYAYRVDDQAATVFLHKFEEGSSVFIGPRYWFPSPDAETFRSFLLALIRSVLI